MKYVKQFCIIAAISFMGEILHFLIPAPIPASIYGIIIMFAGLQTGLLPLASVKETGLFLVEIMPVMFIPPAVGLIDSWDLIKDSILIYALVIFVTTVVVMVVAGRVTQAMIRRGKQHIPKPETKIPAESTESVDGTTKMAKLVEISEMASVKGGKIHE